MATQCLVAKKMKNMQITVNGSLNSGITPKDVVLHIAGVIGTAGGTGFAVEFNGEVFRAMSMEGRMTVCNMAVEVGARAGMVAVDDITIDYVKGRTYAPKGDMWTKAELAWRDLVSDDDAEFDATVVIEGGDIKPQVSWGTSPEMVTDIDGIVPDPALEDDADAKAAINTALDYMGLTGGQKIRDIHVDRVFIGSCTNSRIEDMRAAAQVVKGRQKADSVKEAIVVPGSGAVKAQAESEGLDKVFEAAGFEWREPGCSMCLAMNADKLQPGEHCASTSNRNFESRQGFGGRTHLVSPSMAAAAGIAGHFVNVTDLA